MKKIVLRDRGDVNRLADMFGTSRITVNNSLSRYEKSNSLLGYKIRRYAVEHMGAVEVEFKDDVQTNTNE